MRDPSEELRALDEQDLRRRLRRLDTPQGATIEVDGIGECVNFSSNDYLGLAGSPVQGERMAENVRRFGAGAGASRLICGTMGPHLELEEKIARLKRSEAALVFSSGFATATGAIPALCGKGDVVILDKLAHASLIDGARLSGATLRIYPHNRLERLESHLAWAADSVEEDGRILVVTESVFSMDGDSAPVGEIVELKERFGALLLLDEAHAFGVLGPKGRGLAAADEVEDRIDLQMGTFSKAVGLSGGYLCASRDLVDLLVNRARSFVFSTAPSPALAATISETLEDIAGQPGEEWRARLRENLRLLSPNSRSPILRVILGENEMALRASESLLEKGFLVPAIRYPTVPRGTARLRITLSAAHDREQIESLKNALAELGVAL
jgi:8-amino-7-oxononanoate synthase